MLQTMSTWRLRELMARYQITGRALAHEMRLSESAVANLKSKNKMPRMDGDSLDSLCNALNKLKGNQDSLVITPQVLIEYAPDREPQS